MAHDMAAIASRLEAVATRLENVSSRGGATGDDEPEFVGEFEELIKKHVMNYVNLSKQIGGLVLEQANHVLEAFNEQLVFLRKVGRCKQPKQDELQQFLKPTSAKIEQILGIKDNSRKQSNHLSTISESISALGWVAGVAKPIPYISSLKESGEFYGNRVIKDFKGVDDQQVQWVRAWLMILKELSQYIDSFHKSGLIWNGKGCDPRTCMGAAPASVSTGTKAVVGSGAPPPPAPPPVGGINLSLKPSSNTGDGDRGSLFDALNKGADVTKGLKKVSNDMKTHKNPNLRKGGAVTSSSDSKPAPSAKPSSAAVVAKKPVFALEGKKWLVEHQIGNKELQITDVEMKQTVYMYKCVDSVLQVKGKINSIVVDSCKKVAIVMDDLLSGLEFVNCQSMQCQIMGKISTISIDKTDGCLVYLSKDSTNAEIVTAKSSEINILVPNGDDFSEHALPEQFKSTWNGKNFVTVATDINQ